jgi:hypothetical protein
MDRLCIHVLGAKPRFHQKENIVIDTSRSWQRKGIFPQSLITEILDHPKRLWPGNMSTKDGLNNCIYERIAREQTYSVQLIEPDWLTVVVDHGKEQPKCYWGRFRYSGIEYKMKITDPAAIRKLRLMNYGEHPWRPSFLTISLTELFEPDRRCHKLIAAIIERTN